MRLHHSKTSTVVEEPPRLCGRVGQREPRNTGATWLNLSLTLWSEPHVSPSELLWTLTLHDAAEGQLWASDTCSVYLLSKETYSESDYILPPWLPPAESRSSSSLNCCVTSSPCLAPIPTPASLPQPQGLWDPLSPTNFWTELLFTQQVSLYAFEVCENDSQTGMSGGHLSVPPYFINSFWKIQFALLPPVLWGKQLLTEFNDKIMEFYYSHGQGELQSPLSTFASFSQMCTRLTPP